MAAKIAVKNQSSQPQKARATNRSCASCGKVLMSNDVYSQRVIDFAGGKKSDIMRYVCKQYKG
jgi:hypothetical protein